MVLVSNVFGILVLLSLVGLCGVGVFRQWRAAGRLPFGRWVLHRYIVDIWAAFWVIFVFICVLGLLVLLIGMAQDFGGLRAVGPGWPW